MAVHANHASADVLFRAFRRPVALLEDVVAARPGAARSKKDLAGYYNRLGQEADARGNPIETSDAYARCATLWLELADQTPDDPEVLDGLSASLNNLTLVDPFRRSVAQRTRLVRQALELNRAALSRASARR